MMHIQLIMKSNQSMKVFILLSRTRWQLEPRY